MRWRNRCTRSLEKFSKTMLFHSTCFVFSATSRAAMHDAATTTKRPRSQLLLFVPDLQIRRLFALVRVRTHRHCCHSLVFSYLSSVTT